MRDKFSTMSPDSDLIPKIEFRYTQNKYRNKSSRDQMVCPLPPVKASRCGLVSWGGSVFHRALSCTIDENNTCMESTAGRLSHIKVIHLSSGSQEVIFRSKKELNFDQALDFLTQSLVKPRIFLVITRTRVSSIEPGENLNF